jgi:hypothetical protein
VTTTAIIGFGFAGMVTFSCARHLYRGGLKEDFKIFKDRKPAVWTEVILGDLLALTALITCAVFSDRLPKNSLLRWSWLDLVADKADAGHGSNQMIAGATIPFFGVLFVILLFLNLPRLAEAEEFSFRDGTKNWLHAIPRSLAFGLMHMVVGVPLWLGLALSVPGMWFTSQYFKGGVSRSTMAHSLYNMVIASGLFVYVLIDNAARLKHR